MAATFLNTSPWYETEQTSWYTGIMKPRSIPSHSTDYTLLVDAKYDEKPGLLAYDLFGDQRLFWVFQSMNRDLIVDPIFDLKAGLTITVPTSTRLNAALS